MASPDEPLYKQARRFALDVTTGRHALSKLIPIALWLGDAVLCGLIIWRIPCKLAIPAVQESILSPQKQARIMKP